MLPPFQKADLPPKNRSFRQLVGPGAILVGLSIGSGELIMWPVIVVTYGAGMLWAAALGVFTRYWVNQELGRYTLATGESVYTGFSRLWKGFAGIFIAIIFFALILPGWAVASGGVLKTLIVGTDGWGNYAVWTWITFALVAVILFGPGRAALPVHAWEDYPLRYIVHSPCILIIIFFPNRCGPAGYRKSFLSGHQCSIRYSRCTRCGEFSGKSGNCSDKLHKGLKVLF